MPNNKEKKSAKKGLSNQKLAILAIIVALVLIVVVIVVVIGLFRKKEGEDKNLNRQSYENAIQEVKNENYENGEILPDNDFMFARFYEGEADTSNMYNDMYNLVNITIPDIQKRFSGKSEDEVISFYKTNKERIEKSIGINNQEDYIEFVNYVKDLDLGEFKNAVIEIESFEENEEVSRVPLKIQYTKSDLTVIFEIDNKQGNSNPIRFLAK